MAHLRAIQADLGATLMHLGAIRAHLDASLNHLGSILDSSWPIFAPHWRILAHFSASSTNLGATLAHLGATLAHLGATLPHLGSILGASWFILASHWRILVPLRRISVPHCLLLAPPIEDVHNKPAKTTAISSILRPSTFPQRGGCAKHHE